MSEHRRFGLWVRLAVSSASLAFSLLAFEVWARTFRPRPQMEGFLEYREDVGWIHRPRGEFLHVGWGGGYEFVNHVVMNSAGFRDKERSVSKPPGQLRIAVMGDSMVESIQVPLDRTFPQIIERRLQDEDQRSAEVLNFGVTGYGTDQDFLAYRYFARAYRPDIVILCFFSRNDVFNDSSELENGFPVRPMVKKPFARLSGDGLEWSPFDIAAVRQCDAARREQQTAYGRTWRGHLRRSWRSYEWLREVFADRAEDDGSASQEPNIYALDEDPQVQEAWDLTLGILREFAAETNRDGARLMVMGMPCRVEVDLERRRLLGDTEARTSDPRLPERKVRAVCEERGIPFHNLLDEFSVAGEDSEPLFWPRDGHLTRHGHRVAADAILQFLREHVAPAWAGE